MGDVKVTKDLKNKTLTIEREFNAPKSKLWRAFSDKDWFEKWWGPEGWETTTKEFDFKPGGRTHYCMKCVDKNQGEFYGQESWGLMRYKTIDEPDGFTYDDFFADPKGNVQEGMPGLAVEVEFIETDGKTNLVTRCVGVTADDIEKLVAMGMVEGFGSSFNRLEQLLAE